jgi:hypothetical protein
MTSYVTYRVIYSLFTVGPLSFYNEKILTMNLGFVRNENIPYIVDIGAIFTNIFAYNV